MACMCGLAMGYFLFRYSRCIFILYEIELRRSGAFENGSNLFLNLKLNLLHQVIRLMHPERKKRAIVLVIILILAGAVVGLVAYALRQNINLFYSPTQIAVGEAPLDSTIRAGGMVKLGSVVRDQKTLEVTFLITDYAHSVQVIYDGILPDLFREGQGIVARGKLTEAGNFMAEEVLAKHDENYMPPEVSDALNVAKKSAQIDRINQSE